MTEMIEKKPETQVNSQPSYINALKTSVEQALGSVSPQNVIRYIQDSIRVIEQVFRVAPTIGILLLIVMFTVLQSNEMPFTAMAQETTISSSTLFSLLVDVKTDFETRVEDNQEKALAQSLVAAIANGIRTTFIQDILERQVTIESIIKHLESTVSTEEHSVLNVQPYQINFHATRRASDGLIEELSWEIRVNSDGDVTYLAGLDSEPQPASLDKIVGDLNLFSALGYRVVNTHFTQTRPNQDSDSPITLIAGYYDVAVDDGKMPIQMIEASSGDDNSSDYARLIITPNHTELPVSLTLQVGDTVVAKRN